MPPSGSFKQFMFAFSMIPLSCIVKPYNFVVILSRFSEEMKKNSLSQLNKFIV